MQTGKKENSMMVSVVKEHDGSSRWPHTSRFAENDTEEIRQKLRREAVTQLVVFSNRSNGIIKIYITFSFF